MTDTKFQVSERLLAYAKRLEAQAPPSEPQPDIYYWMDGADDYPGLFYPGEETAECGETE